jgi:hypothetical protein
VKRFLLASGLVAALSGAGLASGVAALGSSGAVLEVRVGDRIRVAGAPLGCQIVRTPELGGRIVVDCRRGGSLSGTYGTLVSSREAAIVKFRSARTAKLLFVAKHEGGVRTCR